MVPRRAPLHRSALLRAAQRSLELAREYALEREAFGAKIAEHQGVSFQLADSLTELLAARLLTYHAAAAFDSEPDRRVVHGKVAMAKLYASEAAGRIVDRALQVLGGRGYMLENPVRASTARSRRPDLGGHERDPAPHRLSGPPQARRRAASALSPPDAGPLADHVPGGLVGVRPPRASMRCGQRDHVLRPRAGSPGGCAHTEPRNDWTCRGRPRHVQIPTCPSRWLEARSASGGTANRGASAPGGSSPARASGRRRSSASRR